MRTARISSCPDASPRPLSARTRLTAAAAAVTTLFVLFGCLEASVSGEAWSFVYDFIVYQTKGASITYPLGYRTGDYRSGFDEEDPTVDAALEMRDVIERTERAERYAWQAEVAIDGGDLPLAVDEINNALEIRPGDWRYRYRAAAYALASSEVDVFEIQEHAAEQQVSDSHVADEKSCSEAIEAYESVFDITQANASGEARRRICGRLYEAYTFRAQARGREGRTAEANADYARAKEYQDLYDEL